MARRDYLTDEDISALSPTEKMAIVSVADETGRPHQSLLSSLMASGPRELVIGEFTRGLSKDYMRERPKTGFVAMTLDRRMWRGAARWTRLARQGSEYEAFNKKPMFRYNSYFGVNTVHYLDLAWIEGPAALPIAGIAAAKVATMARGIEPALRSYSGALSPYARSLIDALASLNFLSWIDAEGEPRIVPVPQARSAGNGRIVFTPGPYGRDLVPIPEGAKASIFSFNMSMESLLALGTYRVSRKSGISRLGVLEIEEVYNPMPPIPGRVWPAPALEPVREF
jgi:hypothetical protein